MTRFNGHLIASQIRVEALASGRAETGLLEDDADDRIDKLADNLDQVLTHGIELQDNVKGELLEATLDKGENEIQHGMPTTPYGYIVLYKEKEGDIFGSRVNEWNQERLFLRSSVPSQKVRLFVV